MLSGLRVLWRGFRMPNRSLRMQPRMIEYLRRTPGLPVQLDPGIVTFYLSNNIYDLDRISEKNFRATSPAESRYGYTPSI